MQLSVGDTVGPAAVIDSEGKSPCESFRRDENGAWTCRSFSSFDAGGQLIEVSRGTVFAPGVEFLGFDLAKWLDNICGESQAGPRCQPAHQRALNQRASAYRLSRPRTRLRC